MYYSRPFEYINYMLYHADKVRTYRLPDGRDIQYNFTAVNRQLYNQSKAI